MLFMPVRTIHDFGFGNIECHNWCTPSSGITVCLYAGFADEDGGTPMRSNLWVRAWNANKTPSVQWEHRERPVYTQCARRDNSMHAVEAS